MIVTVASLALLVNVVVNVRAIIKRNRELSKQCDGVQCLLFLLLWWEYVRAGNEGVAAMNLICAIIAGLSWWISGGKDDWKKLKKRVKEAVARRGAKLVVQPA